MIEASFDGGQDRSAAVSGAYQYDTGQRLRMHGLPSPQELTEMDALLCGEQAAVQAQFGFAGDSQTETRLAQYDPRDGAWIAVIPDEYLTQSRDVHVYVYVSYGQTETEGRAKTCYEAVFRPIGRPAPFGTVTDEQLESWDALRGEIEIALQKAETAIRGAEQQMDGARETMQAAQTAQEEAETARARAEETAEALVAAGETFARMKITAVQLPAGSKATAVRSGDGIVLGVPRGAAGEAGDAGATGTADLTMRVEDGVLTITTSANG